MSLLSAVPARFHKPVLFAVAGALGCLLAAFIGEFWLMATGASAARGGTAVLLVDCSGSMAFDGPLIPANFSPKKMADVREAAKKFSADMVRRGVSVGVVAFSTQAAVITQPPLTTNLADLNAAIDMLEPVAITRTDLGLDEVTRLIQDKPGAQVVLFTDGGATDELGDENPTRAVASAKQLRDAGAQLIAVGTEDATPADLAELTGNPALVFATNNQNIQSAFGKAQKLATDSLIGSSASNNSSLVKIIQVALWTGLIALGLSISVIIAQNLYLKRSLLPGKQVIPGALQGLLCGIVAGAAGALLYSAVPGDHAVLQGMARVLGWCILGLLLGIGVTRVLPNLRISRALFSGAVGGLFGGVAFLLMAALFAMIFDSSVGACCGRLAGAALIGLFIGLMIGLAEALSSTAWLEVRWGPHDARLIALGASPVRVGSNRELCTVYAADHPGEYCNYTFANGKILFQNLPARSQLELSDGDQRQIGSMTLRVKLTNGAIAPSASTVSTPTALQPSLPASGNLALLVNGKKIALSDGQKLASSQLEGIDSSFAGKLIGQCSRHPVKRDILGLKNLSPAPWHLSRPDGSSVSLAIGQTAKLEIGVTLRLGGITAKVVQC